MVPGAPLMNKRSSPANAKLMDSENTAVGVDYSHAYTRVVGSPERRGSLFAQTERELFLTEICQIRARPGDAGRFSHRRIRSVSVSDHHLRFVRQLSIFKKTWAVKPPHPRWKVRHPIPTGA